jgi:hypothetical protein
MEYTGGCHCGRISYRVEGTIDQVLDCNCSLCFKARAWFAFARGAERFRLLSGRDALREYRFTPPGSTEPSITYAFCGTCGIRVFGRGELAELGGVFQVRARLAAKRRHRPHTDVGRFARGGAPGPEGHQRRVGREVQRANRRVDQLTHPAACQVVELSRPHVRDPDVHLTVAIGASAGPCCYEVGAEVIDAFTKRFQGGANLFKKTRPGHAKVDLLKANQDQLIAVGVRGERIYTAPLCTMCRTDLFFSYRKEKNVNGKVGRLMAVIGRR